ncbi:MAG: TraV family lipoprotein [Gammaproteobacteria bacterium]|nr:TraV family lipoprotein [Gammaproteobacteria bacterium]
MPKLFLLSLVLSPLLLVGCATPKYACGVPDGIGCKPISEVHRMAKDGTLKMRSAPNYRDDEASQPKKAPAAQADVMRLAGGANRNTVFDPEPEQAAPPRMTPNIVTVTPGAPVLIPPRTMRVWVSRWPDEDGTLHDETYLYLRLDNGRWLMEGM